MPFPETPRLPAMSPTYMLGCQSWNQRSPQMTTRADGRMQATPFGPASVQAAREARGPACTHVSGRSGRAGLHEAHVRRVVVGDAAELVHAEAPEREVRQGHGCETTRGSRSWRCMRFRAADSRPVF